MNVGQLISRVDPNLAFFNALERLTNAGSEFSEIASDTQDPRLEPDHWRAVLQLELLLLKRWMLRRLMMDDKVVQGHRPFDQAQSILVLQPRYGFAAHILRRAIPFAALGLNTTVAFDKSVHDTAGRIVERLSTALYLKDKLVFSVCEPTTLLESFGSSESPIVLTGALATLRLLRASRPDANLIAATGCCVVVVGFDADAIEQVGRALGFHRLPTSCSNHLLSVFCNLEDGVPTIICLEGPLAQSVPGTFAEEMSRVHPTVILQVCTCDAHREVRLDAAGYTIIQCDSAGEPFERDGIARDPIGGWPGDYVI